MSMLPDCPACGTGKLSIVPQWDEGMQLYYTVECEDCGLEYRHEKFYAYNEVVEFFHGECAPQTCENFAPLVDDGEQLEWECSACGKKRVTKEGEPPYKFCPDCGAAVTEW